MSLLPTGSILVWSGSIGTIPAGFVLCNGANGTPDLRDRFVVGAGTTYNPNDTGGSTTHNHDFTTDGHTHAPSGPPNVAPGTTYADGLASAVDTGTTDTKNHLPPYYALAFIMKT